MNILEVEDMIKGMPDDSLFREAQQPTGQVPQFLVISEIQRRSDMRRRFQAQQEQPQTTVKDQIVQEGIGGMVPQQMRQDLAPQQAAPQMGVPAQPGGMGAPAGAPMQAPVQMASGGLTRMQDMGRVPTVSGGLITNLEAQLAGIENELASLGPYSGRFGPFGRVGVVSPESEAKYARIDQLENLRRDIERRLGLAGRLSEMEPGSELPPARLAASYRESPRLARLRDEDLGVLAGMESRLAIDPATIAAAQPQGIASLPQDDVIEAGLQYTGAPDIAAGVPTQARAQQGAGSVLPDMNGRGVLLPEGQAGPPRVDGPRAEGSAGSTTRSYAEQGLLDASKVQAANYTPAMASALARVDMASPDYSTARDLIASRMGGRRAVAESAVEKLLSESEAEGKEMTAQARKDAMAQALIQFGAGIAGGDVSKGLEKAGTTAFAITQTARDDARKASREARKEGRSIMAQADAATDAAFNALADLDIKTEQGRVAANNALQEMQFDTISKIIDRQAKSEADANRLRVSALSGLASIEQEVIKRLSEREDRQGLNFRAIGSIVKDVLSDNAALIGTNTEPDDIAALIASLTLKTANQIGVDIGSRPRGRLETTESGSVRYTP